MTYNDIWHDDDMQAWAREVLATVVPKMDASAAFISLCPGGPGDVKFWVELGAAIMMDKPIIALVIGDRTISNHLARVADKIVRIEDLSNTEPLRTALHDLGIA